MRCVGAKGSLPSPRIGFGSCPALLIVDFQRGWTDPGSQFSIPLDSELEATAALLAAARARGVPVVYTTVGYEELDASTIPMLRKTPRVAAMGPGTWLVEIDPRVAPAEGDLVVGKKHASAFFGTPLASYLTSRSVDSVLIAGCITSGCVRASAVDAAQHGLHALVVEEAVGDRWPEDHAASLRSIDALYGDVVALEAALASLHGLPDTQRFGYGPPENVEESGG
jgi:nicotinamidase-related amidase